MDIKRITLFLLFSLLYCTGRAQISVKGRVFSENEELPLAGATVQIEGSSKGTFSDEYGNFSLLINKESDTLIVSFIGYKSELLLLKGRGSSPLVVFLRPVSSEMDEIVISTGYEKTPRERVTGSFAFINNALIERSPGSNILNRLEDVASGLTFNKDASTRGNNISIRSLGTIFSNDQPLIVIDNFPYEGDIQNINPNDVESITVLKDAAAASIWGARAGNGVIVITTKKGKADRKQFSAKSDIIWGARPDLFYKSQMSSADYIEVEKILFDRGYYTNSENAVGHLPLTPMVELLIARRDGKITTEDLESGTELLGSYDLRDQYKKHFYRNSLLQQYAVNMSGGNISHRYYLSAGFDQNKLATVGDKFNRITLNSSNGFTLLGGRMEIGSGIYFTRTDDRQNSVSSIRMDGSRPLYPYARFSDDSGNALSVVKDYRASFTESAVQSGLEDWSYVPLNELSQNENRAVSTDLRLNLNSHFLFFQGFKIEVQYQAGLGQSGLREYYSPESYFARNLINSYTQVNSGQTLSYAIPKGGILDQSHHQTFTQNLRGQLSYKNKASENHQLSLLVGSEVFDRTQNMDRMRFYGYDDSHATLKPIDYITFFPQYSNRVATRTIPFMDSRSELSDRGISYYFNGAYTFRQKYTVTASTRLDKSNLFGVKSNQRGVPLYSAGLSWNLSRERFYKLKSLPYVRLRATYGYNGNVDKTMSAYTTAFYYSAAAQTRLPYAQVINPPNPRLRWERVGVFNAGLDIESASSRWKGSLEFYAKRSTDLIGDSPYPPSSGISTFRGNIANMNGRGIDLELTRRHTTKGLIWQSVFLLSHVADKVMDYGVQASTLSYLQSTRLPMSGRQLYTLYALEWGGLNPKDGSPFGVIGGEQSSDYAKILQSTPPAELLSYAGRPRIFGSLRNDLTYKAVSLSFNISYRLGYYFKRESVLYADVLTAKGGHGDFSGRWMQPGHELITQIPSLPEVASANRDNVYRHSAQLIENANHVRLRDIRLQYNLSGSKTPLFKSAQAYLYASNIGLLYKANRHGLDPDFLEIKPPLSLSAGLNFQF